MKRPKLSPWMRSTYEPRDLPQVILFDGGSIIGPFCVHCGGTSEVHGPNRRCPRKIGAMWPPPACLCHASVATDPRPGDRIWVRGEWVTVNASGRLER